MAEDTILVEAHPDIKGRVALWDVHPAHPDGEVFIAGPQPGEEVQQVEVARTPAVLQAISQHRLVEVRSSRSSKASKRALPDTSEDEGSDDVAPAVATSAGSSRATGGSTTKTGK